MAFKRPEYRDIREKLDTEAPDHRGRGYTAFDELMSLHEANKGRLPLTVIAYLFNIGSVNTVKEWNRQRKALASKHENTGEQG